MSRARYRSKSGISGSVAFVVVMVIGIIGVGYLAYQSSIAPKASISISYAQNCNVNFVVTNQDTRILHSWSVTLSITPSTSQISVSPASVGVGALAPQGTYDGSFLLSINNAPPGNYKIHAVLSNGTSTIASSNTLKCHLG